MKRLSTRHKADFWPTSRIVPHEDHEDLQMGIDQEDGSIMLECPRGSNKMRWDIKEQQSKAMPEDKWQKQKEVVPIGLGERGWQAYEPYKQGSNDNLAVYWDEVKDSFFNKGNRWSSIIKDLKKMYPEITTEDLFNLQDQVKYVLQQQRQQIESDFGFFDGPTDLGKRPKGDFPTVQWMPRGHEDDDVDEDVTTASKVEWLYKQADVNEMPDDFEEQIAAKYGPEYNTALMHYNRAISDGHQKEQSIQYAIEEMKKVEIELNPTIFTEVIETYGK